MSLKNTLANGLQQIIRRAGTQISVKYYEQTIGSVWDDDVTLSQSGNTVWTSGVVLPINTNQGSYESVLLEQGKLSNQDQMLFVHGSLILLGSEMQVKIGLGSPNEEKFTTRPIGIISPEVERTKIYRKAFITRLTGSLLGE